MHMQCMHAYLQSLQSGCLQQHLGHSLGAGATHVGNDAVELLGLQVAVEALDQLVHNLRMDQGSNGAAVKACRTAAPAAYMLLCEASGALGRAAKPLHLSKSTLHKPVVTNGLVAGSFPKA